jgi:uncharacterized glyoxalase superfamily protein PhnB
MTTSAKPNNASWVAPYIIVTDVNKACDFYAKAFGFEKVFANEGEEGSITHAELKYKDQALMLGKAGAYGGTTLSPAVSGVESPMNLYFYTENVDDFFEKATANGAKILGEPEEMFWGDRMCRLQDIDGYTWCVATHIPGKDHS